jgi:hypothetical protein
MEAKDYWQLFLETGAPELYMMYANAQKSEEIHVPERSGAGFAGHGLQ